MTQEDYNELSIYLTTIQYPNSNRGIQWLVENETIEEYRQRTSMTRKKIAKVFAMPARLFNDYVHYAVGQIQDAIGVYNIPDITNGNSHLWSKMASHEDGLLLGYDWPYYLGDESITAGGGRVVVVLSDEGVKWLNGIAEKVKGYILEDVPTTNEVNEDEEYFNYLLNELKSLL